MTICCSLLSNINILWYFIIVKHDLYNGITKFDRRDEAVLGNRIQELRKAMNMSQVDLAKVLNVTKQSVSNWENSNIQPSIDMLIRLAEYFNVSTDYLLGLETRRYLEISGLDSKKVQHIQAIINDMLN